jgi:anaerobic selenocysteine-containing dehydrogenase
MSDTVRTHFRTCPLCEATCGLELTVSGDRVVRIRGDREDVLSGGFICPKGSVLHHLHTDPDRCREPMIRRNGSLVPTTWDLAFQEVERLLAPFHDRRQQLGVYLGNPNVHNHALTLYGRALITGLGTRNIFSASTVDQMPRHVASGYLYGNPLAMPVPDLDRCEYLLIVGANPFDSNGSLVTAPDFPGRLRRLQARGGRFAVVDPRRTRTAAAADEHLAIRPGTDAAWLAAIANTLISRGWTDLHDQSEGISGFAAFADSVRGFTPEGVAAATWIPAETTRAIARSLFEADGAAVYVRMGANTAPFGTLASWLGDAISMLTGNLDRPGGLMWPLPAHQRPRTSPGGRGFRIGRSRSAVGDFPEIKGEYPAAAMAGEILADHPGAIRALITIAGNPARSLPDSAHVEAALDHLDALICVDPYVNETTQYADVLLPPPSPLCRSHYDLAFTGLAVRNVANYSPALFEPEGPLEEDILARLALIAMGAGADADPVIVHEMVLNTVLEPHLDPGGALHGMDRSTVMERLGGHSPADRILDVMVRTGWAGDQFERTRDGLSLEHLEARPHGVDLGALSPQLPGILRTESGTVELGAAPLVADMARMQQWCNQLTDEVVLIGRRHLRSNNSWMHNLPRLVSGKDRCTLLVNPADAQRWGVQDGELAEVTSDSGSVTVRVECTDDMAPSVVSLPHGWGHDGSGSKLSVASRHPGINMNRLTNAHAMDPLSGTSVLNGTPVTVTPVPSD